MVQQQPRTQHGKLSETARHVVLPAGIVSTGWPAVRDTCAGFGVSFDPWQDGAGRAILAKRADGKYACSIGGAVISIPRQVGKTFLIGAIVFALCLLFPGLTVIWTAHRARTAGETFSSMRAFAKRKRVRPHIANVVLGSGDEAILFANGSRVLFGARERGFGLGFANVGVLVLDEAQRLTEVAVDDMIPTMNQAANPLAFFTGTPPRPTDPGEVFTRKRADALSGEDTDTLYIEFSADRGCDPMSHKQWAKANPSYPKRTPETAMLRMIKQLSADSFQREGLGIWDEEVGAGEIPRWIELADKHSTIVSNPTWSLAVSPLELGPQWACFGLAGRRADGRFHVEALDHRAGTWWVKARAKEIYDEKKIPLRMRPTGAENGLIAPLREAGVEVEEVSANDSSQAFGSFIDAAGFGHALDDDGELKLDGAGRPIEVPLLHHLNDPDLNKAVKHAKRRTTASGGSTWDEMRSSVEITPLVACTVALGGVPQEQEYAGGFTDLDDW
jgi:hypothetical protein